MIRSWRILLLTVLLPTAAATLIYSGAFRTENVSANPLGGLVSIAAGEVHTCAITNAGTVKCWGLNWGGRLGLGTAERAIYAVPQDTLHLGAAANAIAASADNTCAILEGGSVTCWGPAAFPPSDSSPGVPAGISDLLGSAVALTAGQTHTCALMQTGTIECWGKNTFGQLGSGPMCAIYCSRTIIDVPGISDAIAIAAGSKHSCAVLSTGAVQCWGKNAAGQLGDGTGTGSTAPVSVLNISDAVAIAAGDSHTCALTEGGGVKCWGLGYGSEAIDVPSLTSGVSAMSASQSHTCVLVNSGGVKCWGDNAFGQLGDGLRCGQVCATPVDVIGLQQDVRSVSLGTYHSCAVMISGTAKCWGFDYSGQLGNGEVAFGLYQSEPVDVVAASAKPTPTRTPCAAGGCPTPTPRPAPPQTGLDFSISVDTNGDGLPDCGTASDQTSTCDVGAQEQFRVTLNLHALPPDLGEYIGFEGRFAFAGVTSDNKADVVWPDCGFPATYYAGDFVAFGCAAPVGGVLSSHVGALGTSLFSCSASGSITLVLDGLESTGIIDYNFRTYYEVDAGSEQLEIDCGDTPLAGDVDCSALVNSVDAALMLQSTANLVPWLNCPQFADVNVDTRSDAVDSLLTLQYTAGLIADLPLFPQNP